MTTKRTYYCNLCGGSIAPDGDAGRGIVSGQGVIFGGSHVPDQPLFKFASVQDAEHHLCDPCIFSVRRQEYAPVR